MGRPCQSVAAVGLAVCAFLSGCSRGERFPALHPLSGKVERDGRPVTTGGLYFAPDPATNSPLSVNARLREDGTFAAETSWADANGKTETRPGAPAGRYKVVYHPPGDGSKTGVEVTLPEPVTAGPDSGALTLTLTKEAPAGDGMERDDIPPKP